ncbi:hypothetical protein [Ligilactobacillus aviarius]|uniref:hypothetical protein n=1 Tax=Ligilactobacillus aviarius TaxID=1606 RepID=UPI00195DD663|nr:hypothetical protein [Ligilactobacillus aviarius]MBM6863214.1 hypothetical protein [Ligilactobacillus aviarius]MDM8278984.1 hypothetical protein [Ligilactobacillus aviarius]
MKIKVQDFIDRIVDGDFISSEMETPVNDLDGALKQLLSDFQTTVAQGKLGQQILVITGFEEAVSVRLESGIINLPFANINRVDNFFESSAAEVPVQVELIMEAPDLNASKFHIDQLGSIEMLDNAPMEIAQQIITKVHAGLEQIQSNLAAAKEKKD